MTAEQAASRERPLRVLAINWRDRGDPMGGGAEVHLHEILRRLSARGHTVTWLACAYPSAPAEETDQDGIHYRRRGAWQLANFALPALLRDELRRQPYDVVLDDINKLPFFTPLHTRLPVLAVVPHLFGPTIYRETSPLLATYVALNELPIPIVYRRCRFMVISESTADDLVRRGIRRERISVAHCGMDHEAYRLEPAPPRNALPTLVHLGRLRRYKSVDVAIRALRLLQPDLPGISLHVIGNGPDRPRLERLTAQLGMQDVVHFRGFLPRAEVVDLLHRCHLCLNPSPKEGWGLTVIEANECGVPVVASRRPGLVDSVRDFETGRLARFGDPADFAAKALELLRDPQRWRAASEHAVRWARSFSWDEAATRTEELLRRCMDEGR